MTFPKGAVCDAESTLLECIFQLNTLLVYQCSEAKPHSTKLRSSSTRVSGEGISCTAGAPTGYCQVWHLICDRISSCLPTAGPTSAKTVLAFVDRRSSHLLAVSLHRLSNSPGVRLRAVHLKMTNITKICCRDGQIAVCD